MNYRKFFKIWITVTFIGFFILGCLLIVVDPLDLFGFPKIIGFNHYKSKQSRYLDVCKPYQISRNGAKVIFLGTSRIYMGMPPTLPGYDDNDVYNLGFSALSLKHAENILDYVFEIKNPEVVFIGLDFFQFNKGSYDGTTPGFSEERLHRLAENSDKMKNIEGFKESIKLCATIVPTIKESIEHKNEEDAFVRGWSRINGMRNLHKPSFYSDLNSYKRTYLNFEYDVRAIQCLKRIAKKAKENNVKLYVFFNPLSTDLRNIMYASNKNKHMDTIKKEVTDIFGCVYDFSFSNHMTNDISNYSDASHYRGNVGDKIKENILLGENSEICFVINKSNVSEVLCKEDEAYYQWRNRNLEYSELIADKVQREEFIQEGEFDKYFTIWQ